MDLSSAQLIAEAIDSVRKGKAGKYVVVDGHRRFAAAKLAGEKKVPVVVFRGKSRKAASLIANLHREDLNEIEIAEGLKEIAAEEGLKTNKEIAADVGFSASWVGDLLRLLKLPAGVQAHIAAGDVPVRAERVLRDVAKVSPGIAECVCELAKREKVDPGDFVRLFPDLLAQVPCKQFKDQPTMIPTTGTSSARYVPAGGSPPPRPSSRDLCAESAHPAEELVRTTNA